VTDRGLRSSSGRFVQDSFASVVKLGNFVRPLRSPRPRRRKDLLFVSELTGDTIRYRCHHPAEALALAGVSSDVKIRRDSRLADQLGRYNVFVLHRVPWDEEVGAFFAGARAARKTVLFDTDDLVFEPEAAAAVPMDRVDDAGRDALIDEIRRLRRTLEEADGVIVSTDFLAARARRLNPNVHVIYNVVSREMVEQAERILAEGSRKDSPVTIAYLAGTPTHARDFAEAADAILATLDAHPEVRFLGVGHVHLDERFTHYGARAELVPMQRWRDLPDVLARADINLAPLESNSAFTEAKSCVKYLEAGLLAIPTIASPRGDFRRAMADRVTGVFAEGERDWREALQLLVESRDLRSELGQAARHGVHRDHTTAALSRAVSETVWAAAAGTAGEHD
jgi:glycosyltransferase involved in cell wall biosynthesis